MNPCGAYVLVITHAFKTYFFLLFTSLLSSAATPFLLLDMAHTLPSRAKRPRSSSTESTSDERLHPTLLREPSKRLKATCIALEPGTLSLTSSEQSESSEPDDSEQDDGHSPIDEADQGRVYPEGPPKFLPGHNPLINDPEWQHRLGLNWSREQVDEYLSGLPIFHFRRLSEEERNGITPKGYWIAESEAVAQAYGPFFENRKLADPRRPRLGVFCTEPGAWKQIVRTQDCGIFVDTASFNPEKHFIFGVVIRDFLPETEVLKWMQKVALRTVAMGRDARVSNSPSPSLHGHS